MKFKIILIDFIYMIQNAHPIFIVLSVQSCF